MSSAETHGEIVEKRRLARMKLPPFGHVYLPPGGEAQIANLPAEVREYFDAGVELRPGDVVLDVGANVGVFAMHAAKLEPGVHLVCVEPVPVLFAALARNLASNPVFEGVKVDLHLLGLTAPGEPVEAEFLFFSRLPCDSTGEVEDKRRHFETFFAAKGEAIHRWGKRFGIGIITRAIGAIVAWLPRGRVGRWFSDLATGAERVRCKLSTADRLLRGAGIESVGLVKIDVEGAELKVLEGFSDSSWANVRQVVLEGHDEDGRLDAVLSLLRRVGFDHLHVVRPALAVERGLTNFLAYATRSKK